MADISNLVDKSKELAKALDEAAKNGEKLDSSANDSKQSIGEVKDEAQNLQDVVKNTNYNNFLESIKAIKKGFLGISGIAKRALAIPKAEEAFHLRMERLNRTLKYVDFGKWHDINFAKMHLNELRKFDIAAQASGSTAKNVKALEYSMKKFGGTAQEALAWTKKMEVSLADMEWGGEGGALGQVAFEYGLDFTGAETQEDIDQKIAELLDTLPQRQQVRVAQMLGLSDANFKRLTDKDENGNLTLGTSQEYGRNEAEKTASVDNLNNAKEAFEADQAASIAVEQQNLQYAVDNIGTILGSISQSAAMAYAENVKKLEDATFKRYMERAQTELEKTYAPIEHYIAQFERIIGLLTSILDVTIAIKAFQALGSLGGITKGGGGLISKAGGAIAKWGGRILGGATAVGLGMASFMYGTMKGINDDAQEIEAYKKASPEEKKKMREAQKEKFGGIGLTKYFDQADAAEKRKQAETASEPTAKEVEDDINSRFKAVYEGVDSSSSLSTLFSKNAGFGGTSKAERDLISERLKALSSADAAEKRKQAETASEPTAKEVEDDINSRFKAVYEGVDSSSSLSTLFSKNAGFGGTSKAERDLISERLKALSSADAANLLDEVNALDAKSKENGGKTSRYLMSKEQRQILEDRKNGVILATEGADAALQTAGQNLSTANAGAAEMIGPTVSNSTKMETHDSYTFNVQSPDEARKIHGGIVADKANLNPYSPTLGYSNASADSDNSEVR